jgi:hypothetical protein
VPMGSKWFARQRARGVLREHTTQPPNLYFALALGLAWVNLFPTAVERASLSSPPPPPSAAAHRQLSLPDPPLSRSLSLGVGERGPKHLGTTSNK